MSVTGPLGGDTFFIQSNPIVYLPFIQPGALRSFDTAFHLFLNVCYILFLAFCVHARECGKCVCGVPLSVCVCMW